MKLKVKTLKSAQHIVEVADDATVGQAKAVIGEALGFAVGKIIHAGKLLRDDSAKLSDVNVKDGNFLVVMPSKKKRAAPSAPAPAPAVATPAAAPAPAPAAATSAAAGGSADPPAASAAATATAAAPPAAVAAPLGASSAEVDAKVANLTTMGFPEAEARRALALAFGNVPRAAQYLLEGMPANVPAAAVPPPPPAAAASTAAAPTPPTAAAPAPSGADPLAALRNHAQFNQLRALVQSNPAALPHVLQQIGAASPQLLALINSNMDAFVKMLNEPVAPSQGGAATSATTAAAAPTAGAPAPAAAAPSAGGGLAGLAAAGFNPAAMLASIQGMSAEQRAQLAAAIGVSPDQLQQVAQTMSQMPPAMLAQLMRAGAAGGGGGGGGGGGAPGGLPPGVHVVRLTEEENAAVNRLCELGFTRQQAAEAYLACDKDEALAANFLFQNMD